MSTKVREDGLSMANRVNRASRRSRSGWVAFALGALLLTGAEAQGQGKPEAKPGGKEFRASVLDLAASSQRITIPIHRSVTVETTVEAQRADVVAKQIADVQVVSPTRMLITGGAFGSTTVVLSGTDGKEYVFEVTVELDLEKLNEALKGIDPQSSAKATSVRGNIVLVGTVSSAERARRIEELAALFIPSTTEGKAMTKVQNHLEVAGEQQVLLKVVVAEVSRAAARELGINGFLAGENFRDGFIVNQLGGINPIDIGAAAGAPVTQNLPFVTGTNGIPLGQNSTLSLGFPRAQMQLFIRAMANNSLLSVLAEPNLVAISGETATFLAGGEFPILVPQGDFRVTVEFKEFGVRMNFTPVVQGQQRIRLRVSPEVSELDFTAGVQFQGFIVPGLTSRSMETTVELGNGQTIAIAGLLSEQVRGLSSRVPGIGDVPILGALFRSVNFRRSLTELVVLVTPEIVAPLDAHQKVRLPQDDRIDPNDIELYAMGLLEGSGKCPCEGANCPSKCKRHKGPGIESAPDELSVHGPWGHAGGSDVR
ncbi:MAG: type II and III secretion system protein family protein [Planctomycetota bacterium]